MEDFDFLVGDGIMYELDVTTKREAIEMLIGHLCEQGHLQPQVLQSVIDAIMRREELGSTGIGRGVAVPHAKHNAIEQLLGIIGHIPSGIDYSSLDGEPVTKVFLLLSPSNEPAKHLRALERISRIMRRAA